MEEFDEFIERFTLFSKKRVDVLAMTLQNIFTMRRIGNKTHGDMAEIALSELINQYMYDFSSKHVGRELFRSKEHEEDILVTNDISGEEFAISLKAYGCGPLQLSTDKERQIYAVLAREVSPITEQGVMRRIFSETCFTRLRSTHVVPLIYDEKRHRCNILIFDIERALQSTHRIRLVERARNRRKYPIYLFEDEGGGYIAEARYGGVNANALQRGFWTHTQRAASYFKPLCENWVSYGDNEDLLKLLSKALVASAAGHREALCCIERDIAEINNRGMKE